MPIAQIKRRIAAALPTNSLRARLVSGAFWSLLGAAIARGLGLFSTIIVARILGRETLGAFGIVQSTLAMLGTVAGMGLGTTATKYVGELRQSHPQRVSRVLSLLFFTATISGLITVLIALIAAPWIATAILERPSLTTPVRIGSVLLLISTVDGIQTAALAGFEAFSLIAKRSVLSAGVAFALTVPLVWRFGLDGAVWSLVGTASVSVLFSFSALRDRCRHYGIAWSMNWQAIKSESRMLTEYSLPALGAALLVVPVMWVGNVLLARTPAGYSSMGAVTVINTIRNIAIYLPTVLLAPTFAVMSNSLDRPDVFSKTVKYEITLSSLIVLPVALCIVLTGKFIIPLMFGPQFRGETTMLAWAMLVTGIQATGTGLGNAVNAMGKMWLGFSINAVWGGFFLLGAWILIPRYGAVGYFAGMGLSYLALDVLFLFGIAKKMPALLTGFPVLRLVGSFVAALALSGYLAPRLHLAGAVGSSIAIGGLMAAIIVYVARKSLGTSPVVPIGD